MARPKVISGMNRRQDKSLCKEKEVLGWIAFIWVHQSQSSKLDLRKLQNYNIYLENFWTKVTGPNQFSQAVGHRTTAKVDDWFNYTNVTFSIPVVEKGEIHWEDDQWEVEQIQDHCVEDVCTMFYLLLSQSLINFIHLLCLLYIRCLFFLLHCIYYQSILENSCMISYF